MNELNGGAGDDLIQYTINAPVSIDGGSGNDTVIVVGTLLDDNFVVTSEGIVGAGLNVTFENVEQAEVDGLEGDDNFFIRSTSEGIVTTVIGGLGSDTFSVLGDVTETIIGGAQLEGEPGLITHDITSNDTDYSSLRVDGIGVTISEPAEGQTSVAIVQTDGMTVVSEFGLNDTYEIQLLGDIPTQLTKLYLTVSAAIPSKNDQEQDPISDSILVSSDGVTFTRSVVLTFDSSSNWNTAQAITVKAIDDTAAEGKRTAMISHSINSNDTALQATALPDVGVTIVDDDLFGIVITQTDGRTQVHEGGAIGILASDTYSVELTHPIASGEVVVNLAHDSNVVLSATTLTFTSVTTVHIITVTAPQDVAEKTGLSEIIHTIDTELSTDSRFNSSDAQIVAVTVFDGDSAGVLVLETDESTRVVGEGTDTYQLVLTSQPQDNVTIQIATDGKTVVTPTSVVFTTTNWNTPQEITVSKHPDFEPTEGTEVFAPQQHTLDHIAGPLIIEGGIGTDRDRSLVQSVMLPTESDDEAEPEGESVVTGTSVDSGGVDVLNIFNDDSNAVHLDGLLVDSNLRGTSEIAEGQTGLTHNNLSGLGMGDDLTLDLGDDVTFGGGITFGDVEIVEIMLGKGSETVDIALAVDVTDNADAAILAVHGGGDDDTFTVDNDRSTPMVLYGDTSQDGSRYDGAEGNASSFNNPGDDVIDARLSSESVIIYGGPQNDEIWGSKDDDQIAGGSGDEEIHGQNGNDHIYGDSGFNVVFSDRTLTVHVTPDDDNELQTQDQLVPGNDEIYGDGGDDIILADHGIITQTAGTERLLTTGNVIRVETTTDLGGADDVVFGGLGQDFVLGGEGIEEISGDAGMDVLIGDYGLIVDLDADITTLDTVETTDVNLGAADTINGNADDDIIIGGVAGDTINGNAGDDVILGDNAELTSVTFNATDLVTIGVITARTEGLGAGDVIYGSTGEDVLIGGEGGDRIDGNEDEDLILGDNGVLTDTDGDLANPRFRVLEGTVIYGETPGTNDGDPLIDASNEFSDPAGIPQWAKWEVTLNNDSGDADYIAGGPDNDQIFGQVGDDIIQGDGSIDISTPVDADRDSDGLLVVLASVESLTDGDDYIEGNDGNDVIFGNLGQDDIIGGSSNLFGLVTPEQRQDGTDIIFGGAGTDLIRNNLGDQDETGHARDADMILGDNGNIFRLVGTNGINSGAYLTFNYDNYSAALRIIPRAAELLDYTPGGIDYDVANAINDIGAADEVHGESGDDFIYGMKGSDILFGEGQDDDIIGGYGNDWISGGTGDDGVLGDDGRIYTSRNVEKDNHNDTALSEPLYGIEKVDEADKEIATPGNIQQAVINIDGQLKKTVNLTPFKLGPDDIDYSHKNFEPSYADDIIYGGWGNDFLHGGDGDDAISGAEALENFYNAPQNNGNVLRFGQVRIGEFAAYNEYDPWHKILVDENGVFTEDGTGIEFLLNFNAKDIVPNGSPSDNNDGDDAIFGDLGNDWLVGGTGQDHLYGGYGYDLLNADDDHSTNGGANDTWDTDTTYEDIAYGGAGRDVLIANTGGDRLIDWAGEFNSYIVPYAPFGIFSISRALQPQLMEYLYDLSASDGADQTRADDTAADPARNGEPEGELGLVKQQDFDWKDQTGAPDDPQPGNIPGGRRDVLRSASFNNGSMEAFAPDSGIWAISGGALQVSAESLGGDAVSVFHVDAILPSYYEILATINAGKPTAGWKSNAYVIFDYHSPTDFKFAGVNASIDKMQMGHRTTEGWIVDVQTPCQIKPGTNYNMLVAVHGTTVTLVVDGAEVFSHVFEPRIIDGYTYGLNMGMVGVGSDNSRGAFDNVTVQELPPEITFENTEDFIDNVADLFTGPMVGEWQIIGDRYTALLALGMDRAITIIDLGLEQGLQAASILEFETTLNTQVIGGIVFDYYGPDDFKFVAINADTNQVVIGHHTSKRGWSFDAVVEKDIEAGKDYDLAISLKGTTVSVSLDGYVVSGHVFNSLLVDGSFGLLTANGESSFDTVTVKTDDPAFRVEEDGANLMASAASQELPGAEDALTYVELAPIVDEAIRRWSDYLILDDGVLLLLNEVSFEIVDFADLTLGYTTGTTVLIDDDAAGYGWFVDSTPYDDTEFRRQNADGELLATPSSPAYGDTDLLTVVMHELGHVLGFEDLDPEEHPHDLMSGTLAIGVRRLYTETTITALPLNSWIVRRYSFNNLLNDDGDLVLFITEDNSYFDD